MSRNKLIFEIPIKFQRKKYTFSLTEIEEDRRKESPKESEGAPCLYDVYEPEKSNNDTLVLYVTADSSVAREIINQRKLSTEMASELYVQTMKMWYGSRTDYGDSLVKKEFDRTETTDDFAKAYHYYVMRFSLKNTYEGGEIGNNSGRVDFFINVCQEMPKLEQLSRRLCFDDNFLTDAYDK